MSKRSIKLLSVGNSFSRDSLYFLPGLLREAGYEEVIIAYIATGGCSVEQHLNKALDKSPYGYMKNTNGSWEPSQVDMDYVLEDEEWDYIVIHQCTVHSGYAPSIEPYIDYLTKFIAARCKNPGVKFFWNMTWTYAKYFSKNAFEFYDRDQLKMHNAILDVTRNTILTREPFVGAVPVGTAFMNLRTSYFGDHVNEDGLHAGLYLGRYAAAMVFASYLTGLSAKHFGNTYLPEYCMYRNLDAVREAVDNAIAHPYEITPSKIIESPSVKVLFAGDVRAEDSVKYLYGLLSEKTDSVTVAYINNGEYSKTDVTGTSLSALSLEEAVADEDWNAIVYCGDSEDVKEKKYSGFINAVKANARREDAKVLWNMTWAYQNGCDLPAFQNYSNDRSVMYESILDAMQKEILPSSDFMGIIPSGVTIEIMRSSYLGDDFTVDGVRLREGLAKFAVSLTAAGYLMGMSVRRFFYKPEELKDELEKDGTNIICDAVYYAFRQPYKFRASKYIELAEAGLDGNFGDK